MGGAKGFISTYLKTPFELKNKLHKGHILKYLLTPT
jgi:hypothetical protein